MKLYKLDNNTLIESPDTLIINGNGILNPSEEQLKLAGYKELEYSEYPILEWFENSEESYSENSDTIYVNYVIMPKQNLLEDYMTIIITEMNRKLENDFYWADKCVKLSESNQRDYIGMYTLLSNNKDFIPTFPCTFKNNTLHYFADFDELNDFGLATTTFVNNILLVLREETYKIKNYSNDEMYEYLKNKDIV